MDCYCDYEPARVYSATLRTARKPHTCDECGRQIVPGTKYEMVFGVWDFPSTFRTCAACLEIRRFVKESVPCFCVHHANLHEDARNTADHYGHEADGLRFGVLRRIVLAMRQPAWAASAS
jgi:RNase P subunit RPR2